MSGNGRYDTVLPSHSAYYEETEFSVILSERRPKSSF